MAEAQSAALAALTALEDLAGLANLADLARPQPARNHGGEAPREDPGHICGRAVHARVLQKVLEARVLRLLVNRVHTERTLAGVRDQVVDVLEPGGAPLQRRGKRGGEGQLEAWEGVQTQVGGADAGCGEARCGTRGNTRCG